MKYVFLAIFIIVTSIHLYASLKQDKKLRNQTKPFILLSLLGFYLLAARTPSTWIILALIFSWLGDVLLMPKGVKWFTAGGICFMISHVFFILGYMKEVNFATIPVWLVILLAVLFFAAVTCIFSKLKPHLPKVLFYPMYLSFPAAATVITAIGAILFFISDSSLFFVRFNKDSRLKTHFLVMLTYSIGELLIVLGLL